MTSLVHRPALVTTAPPYNPVEDRRQQIDDARADMDRSFEDAARFPWLDLNDATGPLLPGDLWVVSAKTGQGKSLFVLNWVDALITGSPSLGRARNVAVCPLEVAPKDFLKRLACCRAHIDPVPFFRNEWHRMPNYARSVVGMEFDKLELLDGQLQVPNVPRLTRAGFGKLVHEVVLHGAEIVIVDHLLRMVHGPGENMYAELSETVRVAKELAKEYGIVIVFTSQQGRVKDGDRLAAFRPPDISALKGAGTIEEESDAVLFLYRPLRQGLTRADFTAFRAGEKNLRDLLMPERMAVAIGKHRLDGDALGKQVMLRVSRGKVTDVYGDGGVSRSLTPDGRYIAPGRTYEADERAAMHS